MIKTIALVIIRMTTVTMVLSPGDRITITWIVLATPTKAWIKASCVLKD